MNNLALYSITVLIWGSTWYVITFQTNSMVDPLLSIAYRFAFAAFLLWLYIRWKALPLKLSRNAHIFLIAQGVTLFSFNYWLIYLSTDYLTSGIIAVLFSSIVLMNLINGALFLKNTLSINVILGALLGFPGIMILFATELESFSFNDKGVIGLFFALLGSYLASLGNILSARNQRHNIPVIQGNLYGMTYGALSIFLLAIITGKPLVFEITISFITSLFYLALVGSVLAFGAYLTLIGRIGAERAAYVTLLFPVVALIISTLLEDYQWTLIKIMGVFLILLGNLLVLLPMPIKCFWPLCQKTA